MQLRKWAIVSLSAALLLSCLPPAGAVETEKTAADEVDWNQVIAGKYGENSYSRYRLSHEAGPENPGLVQAVFNEAESRNTRAVQTDGFGSPAVTELLEKATAVFNVDVDKAGFYSLHIRYAYRELAALQNSDLAVRLNGELPFYESGQLLLPRVWSQERLEHRPGENDLTPKSVQVAEPYEYLPGDETGMWGDYFYYFEQGSHRIALQTELGGFCVGELRIGGEPLPDSADDIKTDGFDYNGDILTVEAEEMDLKNSSAITGGGDRTDAGLSPSDPNLKRINIIDGEKFSIPKQRISWKVTVKKDGRYRVGVKYRQDGLQGMFVARRLLLDGREICKGLSDIRFQFGDSWEYRILSDGGQDYVLDLKAGEHTIGLEVDMGAVRPHLREMDEIIFVLNRLYRRIISITGVSPDPFRDFCLHDDIPELLPQFAYIARRLTAIYDELSAMGLRGGQVSILNQMAMQLKTFVKSPHNIQNRLDHYKSNISALSSLVMTLQEQPLSLDYIQLIGRESGSPYKKTGFFANLSFQARSFFGSFVNDYTAVGGSGSGTASEKIEIWIGGGREQAEFLKSIVDESFVPENPNIHVALKLVGISVNQAVLSGTAPDISLSVTRNQPVNLGARGVLQDLSGFEGYTQLAAVLGGEAMKPYTYRGRVYALPITQEFFGMFYRKDILEELGLGVPQTWDDLYDMIPVLQRSNLSIGLPYTMMSTEGIIANGIGAKDIFATLAAQRDQPLYAGDHASIMLDSPAVVSAFEQWVNFYKEYQLDLEYNFYNRFRTGEVPIAIQAYSNYNWLSAAAPELRGLWDIALVPGTRSGGGINRSIAASGSGAIMFKACKNKEAAWKFLSWWASAEAQAAFGNAQEMLMGKASRYYPVNPEAVARLSWTARELGMVREQMSHIREIPEVLGGYYTVRGLDNAFRNVTYSGKNVKESLMEQNLIINSEMARKQKEFKSVRLD